MATLHLTVGLPGVGKTTLARSIASDGRAVRLTPDEWMRPLFGESDAGGKRDVLEGRLIHVAWQALGAGADVILDFGCWSPEERWSLRAIADLAGAEFVMHHVELDEGERRTRASARFAAVPHETFPMSEADHDFFLAQFQPPSAAEILGSPMPHPPASWPSWPAWASDRWPSLPRLDVAGA
jgi:predicted kinase